MLYGTIIAVPEEITLRPLIPSELNPPINPTLVTDGAGLEKVRDFLKRVSVYGFDTETNKTKRFYNRQVRTMQVGDKNEQYVIDLLAFVDGKSELLAEQRYYGKFNNKLRPVVEVLRPSLESKSHLKVGMYLTFEYIVSKWNFGLRPWNFYSIDYVEKILHAGAVHFKTKGFFSLAGIVARYFNYEISKELQSSFDYETPLTEEQIVYAALDTRLPLAVKNIQFDLLKKANLLVPTQIENDAIPAFCDIHLNGVILDHEKWQKIYDEKKTACDAALKELDTYFIPQVGKKRSYTELEMAQLQMEYELLENFTEEELAVREKLTQVHKNVEKIPLRALRDQLLEDRKKLRAEAKKKCTEARKATALAESYQGEAAINYESPTQLLIALRGFKGINKNNCPNTDDDTLEQLGKKHPVALALKQYRGLSKWLKSYGDDWIKPRSELGDNEWVDEQGIPRFGWEDPDTKRVHSNFLQLGAVTGRTSSEKPNLENIPQDGELRSCFITPPPDEYAPDGYDTITIDMSGAELRIIAEMSGAKVWLDAFNTGKDVHSISTEILYPQEWPAEASPDCRYFKIVDDKQLYAKCKCPPHKVRRDDTKSCNFLLAYGGGPPALAIKIGKDQKTAEALLKRHKASFPDIWSFLDKLGQQARMNLEIRSLSNRRRLFNRPSWDKSKEHAKERLKKKGLEREPNHNEISQAMRGLYGSIEREGKNYPFQSLNAEIAKLALGCGFDKDGKPFLWHVLEPKYHALTSNFVHDEFVVWSPKQHTPEVLKVLSEAIAKAGSVFLKKVVMESEAGVAPYWKKG